MGLLDFLKKKKKPRQEIEAQLTPVFSGEQLHVADFNFRLAVIQELMYEQGLLPNFDVWGFCEQYTAREIDLEEEGYTVIPEVKAWFETLPISREMAEQVTELYFDGGNDIYRQLIPFWDGEDEVFDITKVTADDLAQLPNLKTIDGTALLMTDEVKETFRQHGISLRED